jgi:predicted RNA-binding Zn ribbon-like protein
VTTNKLRWRFVGRLCLDFAMTGGRGGWEKYERLMAPSDLRDWFGQSSFALRGVSVDAAAMERAFDLRHAIQQIALALLAGHKPPRPDVEVVNDFAAAPPPARFLDPRSLKLSIATPVALDALLSEIARDALDLAADPRARGRVRQCESPDCGLIFLDDSRPGNRRFCSQGRCGERARARAYRARKARADGA